MVGKRVLGGHQWLGDLPQQRESPETRRSPRRESSRTRRAPAPAPSHAPTPPSTADSAPFHQWNPPQAADRAPARLLWLTDELSFIPMLVDTGASTSVFPRNRLHPTTPLEASKHNLVGAGGAKISCYGSRIIPLQFSRRKFQWDFEVADVNKPILGADFLSAHGLVVDLQRGMLTSNEDQQLVIPCSLHVLTSKGEFSVNRLQRLLEDEFPDVAGLQPFDHHPPEARVYLAVDTADVSPIHSKVRPLSEEKLAAAKAAFLDMETRGVICRSSSPWSSPLHMVRKKCGGWRSCGDYRRLNMATVKDCYPIPLITDATFHLGGCKIFSVIDLKAGYNQIPMSPSSIP